MPRHEPDADVLTHGHPGEEPAEPGAPAASGPSMSQLLAACAAANAVSTPPEDPRGGSRMPESEGEVRRDAA
ncbi:hypothetical protein [Streptomyces sp. NPDC047108]|uniref:hypothetical protein n=1 Tax=Streptomyces sp. NPDC047108 TaxID=3155025 RepID=UPI00340F4482